MSDNNEYEEEEPEYEDEEEEEEEEQEYEGEDQEEARTIVKEITDYEEGKTTYLYDDGTYEVVGHQQEEESGCFVATACYGSALDRHVVFLRCFRDREVMETDVGRCFMRMFNALYYSFSPSLASYLRRHRGAKLVMRYAVVAPVIHLLRLSRYLTRPISKIFREASIVATGLVFVLMCFIVGWILLHLIS